ncbi:MAG: (2Fe-2S)-binding protein, partial [Betaproteobacteria bacterium]|nr:(2Fe-2S)-binding protein [Betaproteobacteria bacterium]NCX74001.1 (2Fe-2S)-binding protein [Betaproteobacteria bacterium]
MHRISLTVNGQEHQLEVKPDSLLVSVLRDNLGLTGTHVG